CDVAPKALMSFRVSEPGPDQATDADITPTGGGDVHVTNPWQPVGSHDSAAQETQHVADLGRALGKQYRLVVVGSVATIPFTLSLGIHALGDSDYVHAGL